MPILQMEKMRSELVTVRGRTRTQVCLGSSSYPTASKRQGPNLHGAKPRAGPTQQKDIPVAMASPDLFFLSVTSQVPAQG